MLPFADLTLLTSHTGTATLIAQIFAVCFLDEVFVWKYDFPALILIIGGGACIILQSDKTEKSFKTDEISSNLTSEMACTFILSTFALHGFTILATLR